MMFTQQTEATTCPTIEPTISRGVQLHEESECKPGRGAPSGDKNAETQGYYRRKIKLEAVSFDDLNFSSSGGEQLPKPFFSNCLTMAVASSLSLPSAVASSSALSSPNTSSIVWICTLSSWVRGLSTDATAH